MLGDDGRFHELEVEPYTPRKYGLRQFLRLGCSEYEYDVLGRLFYGFEKRVERTARQHVHLVYYIDLIFARNGQIVDLLAYLARVVHAVI